MKGFIKDYYEILEVHKKTSPEIIKKTYYALAQKYHPDHYSGDQEWANKKMREINEAYYTLSDPVSRNKYDLIYDQHRVLRDDSNSYKKEQAYGAEIKSSNSNTYKSTSTVDPKTVSKGKIVSYCFIAVAIVAILFLFGITKEKGGESSASLSSNSKLYITKQEGKYGYIDQNGKIVINPIYLRARDFSEGIAPVLTPENKWVVINKIGKIVSVWENIDNIEAFSEGLAVVRKGGKYGFVDQNKLVIPIKYDYADDFSEGLAVVGMREGNSGINMKQGFIDKNDNMIIDYRFQRARKFKEDVAAVTPINSNNGWGYIDKKGQFILKPMYLAAGEFSEGMAPVSVDFGQFGFIDKLGNFIIPPVYNLASSFSEGRACVLVGQKMQFKPFQIIERGKYGYIDRFGNMIIDPKFGYAADFHDGIARIQDEMELSIGNMEIFNEKENRWGYIDKSGNVMWPLTK